MAAQHEAFASLVRDFEPGLLSAADCVRVRRHATAIKNMAATLESLAAARVAQTQLATEAGAKTAAEDYATATGVPKARATEALATAQRLNDQPVLNEAVRAGALSLEQAALISDAAAANPARERDLIDKAKAESLRGLKDACARAKQAADPDPEATQARIHREREFKTWTDGDVAKTFSACTKRQQIAIRAAIETKTDQLFHAARRAGRREPRDAYQMDAFEAICREWLEMQNHTCDPTTSKPKPGRGVTAILRMDYETLATGTVADGQICEIDGLGPIDVATARTLLPEALLYLLITKQGSVAQVINWARGPTRDQQIALLWTSAGRCIVTGCDNPRLQTHHTETWESTHQTRLDALAKPCQHHHDLIHRGWTPHHHPNGTTTIHPPADRA